MSIQEKLITELNQIYSEMPKAIGCIGCGKCCMVQHPHCFFVEFLNIYSQISKWTQEEQNELCFQCMANYLNNSINKTCVFLDTNKRCKIYEYRDYNCRAFGIIPDKIYKKRVKLVKKNFPGIRLGLEKQSDCCGGVKPEKFIGGHKLDELFERIRKLDLELGVSKKDIDECSNYLTFHDHYILVNCANDVDFVKNLTVIKKSFSNQEKQNFLNNIRKKMNLGEKEYGEFKK